MIHDPGKLEQQLREAAGFLRTFHASNTDELADALEEAAEEFYALACAGHRSDAAERMPGATTRGRYGIRRLPNVKPEYDATVHPYGLWDSLERCYVDKYGRPDPVGDYWCLTREVAVMRRRDLNEYAQADEKRTV